MDRAEGGGCCWAQRGGTAGMTPAAISGLMQCLTEARRSFRGTAPSGSAST